jgi:L-amino acid N-acyltransferase YncA
MPDILIRLAGRADLAAINAVYNHYVRASTCTFQVAPETDEGRAAWLAAHGPYHPATVAELDGEVVGWGALSPYHTREAYRQTVEDSVYVRHDRLGRGVGTALLADLLARAGQLRYHAVIALVVAEQAQSLRLHESFGFETVGRLREVGRKFDRWLDVVLMQRLLGPC